SVGQVRDYVDRRGLFAEVGFLEQWQHLLGGGDQTDVQVVGMHVARERSVDLFAGAGAHAIRIGRSVVRWQPGQLDREIEIQSILRGRQMEGEVVRQIVLRE